MLAAKIKFVGKVPREMGNFRLPLELLISHGKPSPFRYECQVSFSQSGFFGMITAPQSYSHASFFLCHKEVSTNNRRKFIASFILFLGFCLNKLQRLFFDNC